MSFSSSVSLSCLLYFTWVLDGKPWVDATYFYVTLFSAHRNFIFFLNHEVFVYILISVAGRRVIHSSICTTFKMMIVAIRYQNFFVQLSLLLTAVRIQKIYVCACASFIQFEVRSNSLKRRAQRATKQQPKRRQTNE